SPSPASRPSRWCGCWRPSRTTTTCRACRRTWTSRRRSWSGCRREALAGRGGGAGVRVLGIDPGSRLTGWGVVETRGGGFRHVASGTIVLVPAADLGARLARLHAECLRLIAAWEPAAVVLERAFVARLVHDVGGVGYADQVSLQTFADLPPAGATVRLLVHTEVREDAIELFGYLRPEERALFHLLRKVKGLGPRTALGVLSGMPLAALLAAIGGGDGGRLQTIPGVGRKLAERIVVECREGAAALAAGAPRADAPVGPDGVLGEAVSALVN